MLKRSSLLSLASVLVAAASAGARSPEGEQLLTAEQIEAYQGGRPSSEIVLTTGEPPEGFPAGTKGTPTYEVAWMIVSGGGLSQGQGSSGESLEAGECPTNHFELESSVGQAVAGTATGENMENGNIYELRTGLLRSIGVFSDGFELGSTCAWSNSTPAVP